MRFHIRKTPNLSCWLVFRHLQIDFFQTWLISSTFWYQFRWSWPSFKVTVRREIENFGVHFHRNFDLDDILYVAITSWFVEAKFFAQVLSQGENSADAILWTLLTQFYNIYHQHCPLLGHLWTDLFETWCDVKHNYTLQSDSSLNDLDVHTRS